jgi:MFS transporter, Spinster family, sphingosine-1-phosphate transporter
VSTRRPATPTAEPPSRSRRGPASATGPAAVSALVLLAVANLINYADRNVLVSTTIELRDDWHLTDTDIGILGWIYMASHALATLPLGWFGDRYDRRGVIAGGLMLASLASIAGALAVEFWGLAASRLLVGLGTAAVVPVANSLIGELFEGPTKASRLTVFNLGLFLGGATGVVIGAALGVSPALLALGVAGIATALAIRWLPVPARRVGGVVGLTWPRFKTQARELVKVRTLRWVMTSCTVLAFAAGALGYWFLDFLKLDKGMSQRSATGLMGAVLVAGLAGIVVGGRVSDRLRTRWAHGRLLTVVIGMFISLPFTIACVFLPPGIPLYVSSVLSMFFICWYHAPIAASVDDLAHDDRSATAQALVIFLMHLLGTAPGVFAIGALNEPLGRKGAMMVATAMFAVGALCMIRALPSFARDSDTARGPDAGPPP